MENEKQSEEIKPKNTSRKVRTTIYKNEKSSNLICISKN